MKKSKLPFMLITTALIFHVICPIRSSAASETVVRTGTGQSPVHEVSEPQKINDIFQASSLSSLDLNNEQNASSGDISANYFYKLIYSKANNQYSVEMDIDFFVYGKTYHANVIGNVESIPLPTNDTYLTGPLYGQLDGIAGCNVVVGFNQIEGQDAISFYATFEKGATQVIAHFGQSIFSPNQFNAILDIVNNDEIPRDTAANGTTVLSSNDYTQIGYVTATMSSLATMNGISGKAHTCYVYFKPGGISTDAENIILLRIDSNCRNLRNSQASFPIYAANISRIEIDLLMKDNDHAFPSPQVNNFLRLPSYVSKNGTISYNFGSILASMLSYIIGLIPGETAASISAAIDIYGDIANNANAGYRIDATGNAEIVTNFPGGEVFDDPPFLAGIMLEGGRSAGKVYNYSVTSRVQYSFFSEGGNSYYSGNRATLNFSIDDYTPV